VPTPNSLSRLGKPHPALSLHPHFLRPHLISIEPTLG
jgi:hypothetical protein